MSPSKVTVVPSSHVFFDAINHRRTVYKLNDKATISDERIEEIIDECILNVPSSWNTQSTRAAIYLGEQHKTFWDVVMAAAKESVLKEKGEEAWKRNAERFEGFKKGYGTVAFFEDAAAIKGLQERFPHMPSDALSQFSEHTSAMHQIVAWTALELEGFGASLQHAHYTPGVEHGIKKHFELPPAWNMKAALVFGGLAEEMPSRPEKKPLSETVRVFKGQL